MHRRWKWIGTIIVLGCLRGCPVVGTFNSGNFGALGAFGGAAGVLNAGGGGGGGIPNLGIPFQQIAPPAQPGVFAGSGGGP